MFRKYADSEDIAKKYAKFRVGEVVTLLRDIENESVFERKCGVFEAGTSMQIKEIGSWIDIPRIRIDELDNFTIDEEAFVYDLEPLNGTESNIIISCSSDNFISGSVTSDNYAKLYKEKTSGRKRKRFIFICLCIIGLVLVSAMSFVALRKICDICGVQDNTLYVGMTVIISCTYLLIAFVCGTNYFIPQFKKKKKLNNGV